METSELQQESSTTSQPQSQHHWLQKLVGEWEYETEVIMEANPLPEKTTGTEKVRSLGELWVVAEGQGEMPGCGAVTTLMTLGYDPQKQRYVGTWIGSMMTDLWIYDGELDADRNVLTLNSEGPAMSGKGRLGQYRDVIEFKSDNHRVMTSLFLDENGKWNHFMTASYQRITK